MTDPGTPEVLLQLAATIAREAGDLLLRRVNERRTGVETKSTPTDMVSEVDRESEAIIVDRIIAARPGDGIVAEEGTARTGTSGVRWVIDPLDGTTNYLYRIPAFAVSIGVERDGAVVAGVVNDPSRREMFLASAGGGAFLNTERLTVSSQAELQGALIGTGFGYDPAKRRVQGALVAGVLPVIRDIRRGGAAAIDLCWVACGRLDGYFERGLQEWDYSAGSLIVREAGGRFERDDDGLVVAAGPAIFTGLQTLAR